MTLEINNYESFIYRLQNLYPSVEFSTLTLYHIDEWTAVVKGEILFAENINHRVREVIDYNEKLIQSYSYEVYKGDEKIYWYDSFPHPHIPDLSINHPNHKHIPPDMKHHRIPAPEISFNRINIPFLIEEIEAMISNDES
jgi:hypothetical protein